jgi:hypothetical protein
MQARAMGLVGLALASAFMAREAREKAQDAVVRVNRRGSLRQGRFGPKRLRRMRRAEAREGAVW